MRFSTALALITFAFAGCANHAGVSPSQNPSLGAISPSATAASQNGAMQRGLDSWLKEEWTPLTTPATSKSNVNPSDTVTTNAAQPSKVQNEPAAAITPSEPKDNTSFTLQKYADKWKVYQENKAKMDAEKAKEPSHIEKIQNMPVIGK